MGETTGRESMELSPFGMGSLKGHTVVWIEWDEHSDTLLVTMADGCQFEFAGVWHNDSTAGLAVSVVRPIDNQGEMNQ